MNKYIIKETDEAANKNTKLTESSANCDRNFWSVSQLAAALFPL